MDMGHFLSWPQKPASCNGSFVVSDQGASDVNDAWNRFNASSGIVILSAAGSAGTSAMPANSDTWGCNLVIAAGDCVGVGTTGTR